MHITFDTANLSALDRQVLALLGGIATASADEAETAVTPKAEKPVAKPAAKKATAKKPESKPEPAAEEPLPDEEDEEAEVDETGEDETSDEDLLELAVKKATEMVAGGEAAKVREALDAAGASRVRELNKDNVREFFKALS